MIAQSSQIISLSNGTEVGEYSVSTINAEYSVPRDTGNINFRIL